MASGPITAWQTDGEKIEIMTDFIFLDSKITADGAHRHKIKGHLVLWGEAITNLNSIRKQSYHFTKKGIYSQSFGFSSSHVQMLESEYKEGWVPKNWPFWIAVYSIPGKQE